MALTSKLLARVPGLIHGYGTRAEPVPSVVAAHWEKARPRWKQVHGIAVGMACGAGQELGEVDAIATRERELPIGVMTADCVPVVLARRDGRAAAAVHAGWRGTRAGILGALFARLAHDGESPRDWVAAIGPSIGPCCYEVSAELAEDFRKEFAVAFGEKLVTPAARMLDLPAINQEQLRALGVETDLIRACTKCSKSSDGSPLFHSYRREGGGTRQWSVAELSG